MNEFFDVFPKESPRIPPNKYVELFIDVAPRTAPILSVPYRMALVKIKELNT